LLRTECPSRTVQPARQLSAALDGLQHLLQLPQRDDDDTHRQPFSVDQRVDFTALDLLAGVVTYLVVLPAPFLRI
jgi:hypothetical protein